MRMYVQRGEVYTHGNYVRKNKTNLRKKILNEQRFLKMENLMGA